MPNTKKTVEQVSSATAKPKVEKEKAYRHNAVADMLLTIAFWGFAVFGAYSFCRDQDSTFKFGVIMVAVALAIVGAKYIAIGVGHFVSNRYLNRAPFNNPLSDPVNMKKWYDQAWQLTIHVSMTIFELYVVWDEPWFTETEKVWVPHPRDQVYSDSLILLYQVQMCIWIVTAFSHRYLEERRYDYIVMFVHHIITIILVSVSHYMNYCRIGTLVLLVHDISDVPIDTMKMLHYIGLEGSAGRHAAEIAFIGNLVVWITVRLVIFPTQVIRSTLFESLKHVAPVHVQEMTFWERLQLWHIPNCPQYWEMNLALMALQIMHVYWTFLLLNILFKALKSEQNIAEVGQSVYEEPSSKDD